MIIYNKNSKQIQLQGIHAIFMLLNKKTVEAHVYGHDGGRGHRVGCHDDWIAFVMDNALLKIHHIYRDVSIDLPLLTHIGVLPIYPHCPPGLTFMFLYKQCE
jgi:hypothetical protein